MRDTEEQNNTVGELVLTNTADREQFKQHII